MSRLAAVLLAALALVLAALGAAGCGEGAGAAGEDGGRAAPALRLGMVANTIGYGTAMGREQDLLQAAGATELREEILWSVVERHRGERRWGAYDRLFVSASRRGLRMLPLLSDTPRWAMTKNRRLPIRAGAYGAFVHDAVARYGPSGTFWRDHPELDRTLAPAVFELWNEPYLVGPVVDDQLEATRYAALVRAGVAAGREADTAARFLLAVDTSLAGHPGVPERWLTRLQNADPDILKRVDGVAAHPYGIDLGLGQNALDELDLALRRHGRRLPMWVTEIGWSTCTRAGGCVSEARQADNLSDFLDTVRTRYRGRVPAVFVYRLRDLRVGLAADKEGGFGLLRLDGKRKPAYAAVHRFAVKLGGR